MVGDMTYVDTKDNLGGLQHLHGTELNGVTRFGFMAQALASAPERNCGENYNRHTK